MDMAGSVSDATMASRLLPIPPNVDPASSPARIRKNVPSARRYTSAMMFPAKFIGVWEVNVGTSRPAESVEANRMYGVAVKIHEVVVETTGCFRKSLARSA
jgi:hypothetical protein